MHFLTARHIVDDLIRSCSPSSGDLVLDLGAGTGAITAPLAATGARVLAVERDPEFARRLRTRLGTTTNVHVVQADARTFRLPGKDFLVVSSIPYGISTALLRRLLGPRTTRLRRAALVVEWGFAKRLTEPLPRSTELAWWAARFDIRLLRKVPAYCFRPSPTVDSAQLLLRRRSRSTARGEQVLWALLRTAARQPTRSARSTVTALAGKGAHRLLRRHGIDPAAPTAGVRPLLWAAVAEDLAAR
ncbi:23S rRNA (adenine-N6)-dimethyltransferase [Saccharomonospora amisosensis]|uniref:23S rRNA (Adenine-N6)-dimethyltransferase n=1 Tax=Saccharomonospora amisosensis TaxID=1128677 RepID=A0A7X5UNL9_9PSEU|nr:rRNA adenine N(6)-methyltransferase family protein [Saccharomonospora amisosensis]NIJ11062.1 23S rRNA (adenine-N6)-dimethyltransferase [Saccharomonospora amisosensis]